MKNVIYSKKQLTANRGRAISIRERVAEPECDTAIRKSFVYLVYKASAVPEKMPKPTVRVIKVVDTDSRKETFFLRIKGEVCCKQGRFIYMVRYLHALEVRLLWKDHVLSPDPA